MSALRRWLVLGAFGTLALLGGCAAVPPPVPMALPVDQSPAEGIPPEKQGEFDQDLSIRLQRLAAADGSGSLQAVARDDGLPALRVTDAAFRGDSGELTPAALALLGQFEQQLAASNPCVVHIVGERVGDLPPAIDLGERRAAAVASVLQAVGMPETRVRYESRMVANRAGGALLVVRPIVRDQVAQAWMPPPLEGGS